MVQLLFSTLVWYNHIVKNLPFLLANCRQFWKCRLNCRQKKFSKKPISRLSFRFPTSKLSMFLNSSFFNSHDYNIKWLCIAANLPRSQEAKRGARCAKVIESTIKRSFLTIPLHKEIHKKYVPSVSLKNSLQDFSLQLHWIAEH